MELQTTPRVGNFYDGGLPAQDDRPAQPPRPEHPPRILLDRLDEHGVEEFALQRRIAYRDHELGELLVPADLDHFRTDLTSVPALFTWLVPKSGAHLPAALIHDGLVHASDEAPTYVSTDGHVVDRIDADRVFRDAMRDTGTGVIRRWLVWTAVATASLWSGPRWQWSTVQLWRYRALIVGTFGLIAYLGYCASADLFDRHWWGAWQLPWMGDRPWWVEALGGLSGGVVIPLALGLLWGRYRAVAFIGGVALATLFHVTIVVFLVAAAYKLAEMVARRSPGLALALGLLVLLGAVGLWVPLLVEGW